MSKQISFRLPSELAAALKARLEALELNVSEYFIWLARQDLGDRTQKPKLIDRVIDLETRIAKIEAKLND
jgi:hypothetical protein